MAVDRDGGARLDPPPVAGVADFNIGDAVAWLVFLTVAGVGTLIVTRRPGNLIGWLFLMV